MASTKPEVHLPNIATPTEEDRGVPRPGNMRRKFRVIGLPCSSRDTI